MTDNTRTPYERLHNATDPEKLQQILIAFSDCVTEYGGGLFSSDPKERANTAANQRDFIFPFCSTFILTQHLEMAKAQTDIARRIEQSAKENTEIAKLIQKGSDETAQLTKDIKALTNRTTCLTKWITWLTAAVLAVAIITLIAMIRLDSTHAGKGGAELPNRPRVTQKAP
jgi:hypothetical protein